MNPPQILHGNNLDLLRTLPDCSVDSIVTDPPYELGFMGKKWDSTGIAYSVELWSECLRVLKHGGHLLAFSGSRTYHRMVVAIEDAGFEIRDQIMWVYGSGFPKSLDVSKAIDKMNGEIGRKQKFTEFMRSTGITAKQIDDATGTMMGSHYTTHPTQPAIPTAALWKIIRPMIDDVPDWVDELVERTEAKRDVIGQRTTGAALSNKSSGLETGSGGTDFGSGQNTINITTPATDAAQQWSGWGTALKPAHEPIVMARKPLGEKTVAENVLRYGTGAINIDASRVGTEGGTQRATNEKHLGRTSMADFTKGNFGVDELDKGRFPANFIHDGSDEVLALFPDTGKSQGGRIGKKSMGNVTNVPAGVYEAGDAGYGDSGSAARFFYCAKASKAERNAGLEALPEKQPVGGADKWTEQDRRRGEGVTRQPSQNFHPTVKPVALMRYLVRMVTPPDGTVLDPFTGSGTTLVAAVLEGFNSIGMEMTADYLPIIEGRVAWALAQEPEQPTLF